MRHNHRCAPTRETARAAELANLIREQAADMKAQRKGTLGLPGHYVCGGYDVTPFRLEALLTGRGLTRQERHLVRARLCGRSFRSIATDRMARGVTHQRLAQVERAALARLGGAVTVEAVHALERQQRARWMLERGRLVGPWELHTAAA